MDLDSLMLKYFFYNNLFCFGLFLFVDVFYSLALEDGIIALTMYYDDDEEGRSLSMLVISKSRLRV